jgi:hypothetical protein
MGLVEVRNKTIARFEVSQLRLFIVGFGLAAVVPAP